uniref:Acetyltransf_18 domain-containing protein n=1 Tax=Gongylonema pulchrum TaxID=637853 RepID=A0A183ESQ1_9BILA
LTADELCVTFLRQSVKGVYEVTVQQKDGRSVADLLISRGFAVPFKWGIGPPLPSYETCSLVRSDDLEHVLPIFTAQLSDHLETVDQVIDVYVLFTLL